MKIAVCDRSAGDAEQLAGWIRQYCSLYGFPAAISFFLEPEALARCEDSLDIAFVCFGGGVGFSSARLLRERNRDCGIILVDDTGDYAVRSVRLHCTDFLIRPLTFRHVVRSMSLATRGPGR